MDLVLLKNLLNKIEKKHFKDVTGLTGWYLNNKNDTIEHLFKKEKRLPYIVRYYTESKRVCCYIIIRKNGFVDFNFLDDTDDSPIRTEVYGLEEVYVQQLVTWLYKTVEVPKKKFPSLESLFENDEDVSYEELMAFIDVCVNTRL